MDEVRRLIDEGRIGMVIDVRSPMSQEITGRIPGAVTVDPKNLKFDLIAIEPKSEVVVYCACPNEATAVVVAKALMQHGFKRVRPLAWRHRCVDRRGSRGGTLTALGPRMREDDNIRPRRPCRERGNPATGC